MSLKAKYPRLARGLKVLKWSALIFFGSLLLLIACEFVMSHIQVEQESVSEVSGLTYEVYITKSGPHSDVMVPVRNDVRDWSVDFPFSNNDNPDTSLQWVAIGWGDEDFYLNTPTWGDLTMGRACNAAFGLGTAAMHASYQFNVPEDRPIIKLMLNQAQYKRLCDFIANSLITAENGSHVLLLSQHPGVNGSYDRYYDANGTYSLVYNCNTWVNDALKSCGQKACYWTVSAGGIFYQYGI
jgi:uncharacterized protein (TIGR02117 family)